MNECTCDKMLEGVACSFCRLPDQTRNGQYPPPPCSVPRRFVVDVDSLLTCLLYRHRKAVDATGEYAEVARLAREARELSEAQNVKADRT